MTLLEAYNEYCKEEFDAAPVTELPFPDDELGIAYSEYYDRKSKREIPIATTWNRKTGRWCVYVDHKLVSTEPMTEQQLIDTLCAGTWDSLIADAYDKVVEMYGEEE